MRCVGHVACMGVKTTAYRLFQINNLMQSALNLHTVWLFTEVDVTRGCSNTICPPEDE